MPFSAKMVDFDRSTTCSVVPYELCAAKTAKDFSPGTSVFDHCRNVGHVARELARMSPGSLRALLPPDPALAASLHDIGKVSPGFMCKYFRHTLVEKYAPDLAEKIPFCTRHAAISAAALDRWLGTGPMATPVSIATAAHHGSADRSYPPDTAETLGGVAWADERRKLIQALIAHFGGSFQDAVSAHSGLLAGLVCVADWIGSSEDFFPADQPPVRDGDPQDTARYAVSCCGFEPSRICRGKSFEQIFGFQPREVQRQFMEHVRKPGVYVLEAPMGIGKTEAALFAVYRLLEQGYHRGFYFALPTRLTSDRIHKRVAAFLDGITDSSRTPRLAHGMAWLREFDRGGKEFSPGESWFNPMKRALLHPYAVGTIDQALLSVMNVKHGFVRLYGLAGKAVILDEVHSYDVYTGTLLDELVERLRAIGCTVIILSATLTAKRRQALVSGDSGTSLGEDAYPLLTACPEGELPSGIPLADSGSVEKLVSLENWDDACVSMEAVEAARRGICVVCIANTVARAQAWYRAVQAERRENEFETGLLHARFPLSRREVIEEHWMGLLGSGHDQRPHGCVLVATQILEQSVDIDADLMISELAPSDMLLQRMGRLWRHSRAKRPILAPQMTVIAADPSMCASREDVAVTLGKENCCVYAPYVLLRTHAVWKKLCSIRLPVDIRGIIEATYAEPLREESALLQELRKHLKEKSERLRRMALSARDGVQGIPVSSDEEQNAPTRYSDLPMRNVLLLKQVRLIDGHSGRAAVCLLDGTELILVSREPDYHATRLLHKWTVSVAAHHLPERGAVRQNACWLDRHFHDTPVVLLLQEGGRLICFHGPETVLRYSDEQGVWREGNDPVRGGSEDAGDFDPFSMQW